MKAEQSERTQFSLVPTGWTLRDVGWLFWMSLMLFATLLSSSSYVAALPLIQEEWSLNNTEAGIIFSAYLAGFAASALFVLPLTDRFGSKIILVTATILSVVSHALFPLVADGIVSAIVLRSVAGLGLVGVYNPGMRIVAERFANSGRGAAVGTYVTFFYAASSVSLFLTGLFMSRFEWRDSYLIVSLIGASSIPLAYLLLRNHQSPGTMQSSGRLDLGVLKNRAIRFYIMGYTLHAAELYIVRVWLPTLLVAVLVAQGVGDAEAAVRAATVGGIALSIGAIGPVIGGIISDRMGRAYSAAAIFALSGACSWAIGWIIGMPWFLIVAVAVVYGWAIGADSAIYSTAVTEVSEPQRLGSTLAVHSFLGFMGGVVGPIIVGGILDISPQSIQWGLAFSFTGLLAVVAVAGLLRFHYSPGQISKTRGG